MKNFNRDRGHSSDRGPRDFGKKSFAGRGFGEDRGPRQMFDATCSKCGKSCQIPFRPTGGRPVFCSDCFAAEKNSAPSFGGERSFSRPERSFGRPSFGGNRPAPSAPSVNLDQFKQQFEALNSKLDRILRALPQEVVVSAPTKAPKEALGKVKPAAKPVKAVAKPKSKKKK